MRILILGAGKMGSFFTDVLSFDHEVAVYDIKPQNLRFMYNCLRFTSLDEIKEFRPELVINAATVKYTLDAFRQVLPVIPQDCIISDIASVKTGLQEFYDNSGFRYVSTHPMFGPTFANLDQLSTENAIIIKEGDCLGKVFFKDLYQRLGLNIFEYTFDEHDETVAYSLSIPFVSTFVFAAVMKHQDAPGTTFKRHMAIARSDETSGRSRYNIQTPHGNSKGSFERRRLSASGNTVQPTYSETGGRNTYRTERAS